MKTFLIMHATEARVHEDMRTLGKTVQAEGDDDMQISDGYHTMDELYDHRITLFIALCRMIQNDGHPLVKPWRSMKHEEGGDPMYEGWFVMGLGTEPGRQITYHLPLSRWEETEFAETLEHAPKFDGHTPTDVLERLSKL